MLVQPTFSAVSEATAFLAQRMPARLTPAERDAIEIAMAEVLTNIVEHGFAPGAGEPVRLVWQDGPQALEVEVWDTGRPIPPGSLATCKDPFDFDPTDYAALPEGGMGLALIRAAFDTMDYRSAGGRNCMRLTKRFG